MTLDDTATTAVTGPIGAAPQRIGQPPANLSPTRQGLHRLAVYVVSPAQQRVNNEMALQWTPGGFGTPVFDGRQVWVDGGRVSVRDGGQVRSVLAGSLEDAARLVLDGPPDGQFAAGLDVPPPDEPGASLGIDEEAARWIGDWYGFVWSILEELRAAHPDVSSPVRLWPEHFDAAFDLVVPGGGRATLGGSPGDQDEPEPYLYVLPPEGVPDGSRLWNAGSFPGAIVMVSELVRAADPRAQALAFFRERLAAVGA
jgi:hypothetical protein